MLRKIGEGGAGAGEWATSGLGKLRDWMGNAGGSGAGGTTSPADPSDGTQPAPER